MAWHPRLVIPMRPPRQNLFPSVNSLASSTLLSPRALRMSGRFASLSPFWLGPSSHRPSRVIYLESELSTLIRGSRIRLQTVSACRGSSVASSVARALPPPTAADDLMLIIWQSLDLGLPDHMMFWAACSLGYFGFLRASQFLTCLASPLPST